MILYPTALYFPAWPCTQKGPGSFAHSRFGHYFCSNLYGCAPRGPRGVQKSRKIFYIWNWSLFALIFCSICTKNLQNWKKQVKKPCFLKVFWIFFNLRAILAHQTLNGMFSGSWGFLCHPWGLWGQIHIEDIKVLAFVFNFSWVVAPPTTFFKQFKIKSKVTFIGL